MKKILALILIFILINFSAYAAVFPNEFWGVNSKYEEAVNAKDYNSIIKYGNQVIGIVKKLPDSEEKRSTLITRYNEVGLAYAAISEYNSAGLIFEELYNYTSQFGDDYYDYKKGANERALQYKSQIRLYTDGGDSVYYGAKNEKQNGILFGICANGETRKKLSGESMILTYQEFGQEFIDYNIQVLIDASNSDCAVEFALNCPGEGNDIRNIKSKTSYLKEISDIFKGFPTVPIYLRFGAEFNIWSNPATPDEFIEAYRYVSDYFKTNNPNVAMVWSPNQVSGWNVNMHDFYPGDEYVDWVGVSLYAQKYFLSDNSQSSDSSIFFKTGINSDPVLAIQDLCDTYGDRKPIMISESGFGHRLVKSGEDTTNFALLRMKQFYSYLPMVYPEIKLIAHFDWYVTAEHENNDFRLSNNPLLQNTYLNLVKSPRFIQDSYMNNTDFCYNEITNESVLPSIFELSCYSHMHGAEIKHITYFIDDEYVGMSGEIPYTTYIDATNFTGKRKLRAVCEFNNGKTIETEKEILIYNSNIDIKVDIYGKRTEFDQNPVLYKDRTMVPVRKIFEELGATVSWDETTQTVTGKKGDRVITMSVGKRIMTVNGKNIYLDVSPILLSDRTLVPARAVAEGLGCNVDWDGQTNTVIIT